MDVCGTHRSKGRYQSCFGFTRFRVSGEYRELFMEFKRHFEAETEQLRDETLAKEIAILDKLINK